MIIEVILPQPMTPEEVTSFRSVPMGISLTSGGDGTSFLSDDGTYKPIAVDSNITIADVDGLLVALSDIEDDIEERQPLAEVLTNTTASFTAAQQSKLAGIEVGAQVNVVPDWAVITNKPATFAPSSHTHVISEVTGLQGALDGKIEATQIGIAGGLATLDGSGFVPASQLPSYVDDVLEAANLAAFPVTGATGKIYVALDTNKTYRWSGSAYIFITSGPVDSVAGKTGVVTLVKADVGLPLVDNTSDLNKPLSTATATALAGKQDTLGFTPYNATNPAGYTTNTGTVTAVTVATANGFSASVAGQGTTPALTLSLQDASAAQAGKLTAADWATFNAKQVAVGRVAIFERTDFLNTTITSQGAFIAFNLFSGTIGVAADADYSVNHHGIWLVRSSTSLNSGYAALTNASSTMLSVGMVFEACFKTPAVFTNTRVSLGHVNMGDHNTAGPTNGAWIEIAAGVLTGNTASASSTSATATILTLTAATYYHVRITVVSLSSILYEAYSDAGTLLGSASLTTNIPTSTATRLRSGFIATGNSGAAADITKMDYMGLYAPGMQRGAL